MKVKIQFKASTNLPKACNYLISLGYEPILTLDTFKAIVVNYDLDINPKPNLVDLVDWNEVVSILPLK